MKARLFKNLYVRLIVSVFFLIRGTIVFFIISKYKGISDFCWLYRVSDIHFFERISYYLIKKVVKDINIKGKNIILESFLRSKYPEFHINKFLKSQSEKYVISRDIIVLKPRLKHEKGVIMLKYTNKFNGFLALFDLDKISDNYYIVLEPCWAGYADTSIFMFINLKFPVVVQSPENNDFNFIKSLGSNLFPIKMGAADWVNSDHFYPESNCKKEYDLIMVASWAAIKKHKMLFMALGLIKSRSIKVLLVGYDWGGRTKADIIREMQKYDLHNITVEIKANLPHSEVSKCLNRSKVFLLLTMKEGSNKSFLEAFFADVPVILYENFIGGGHKNKINSQTGILSSYKDLHENIEYMLDNYQNFFPRDWALKNTGSFISTMRLNKFIKEIAIANSENYSTDIIEKTNSPNLTYKDETLRERFKKDYQFIYSCKRVI